MTSPDALRAAFEQWVTAKPYEMPVDRLDAYGAEYRLDEVELAWEAWQAALAHAAPTPEPVDRAAIAAAVEREWAKVTHYNGWTQSEMAGAQSFKLMVMRLLTGGTSAKPSKQLCEHASVKWDALGGRGVCHSCNATVFCSNATRQASGRYDCGRNNLQCGFPACLLTEGTDERSGT